MICPDCKTEHGKGWKCPPTEIVIDPVDAALDNLHTSRSRVEAKATLEDLEAKISSLIHDFEVETGIQVYTIGTPGYLKASTTVEISFRVDNRRESQ